MPFSPARNRSWNRPAYVAGGGSTDLAHAWFVYDFSADTPGQSITTGHSGINTTSALVSSDTAPNSAKNIITAAQTPGGFGTWGYIMDLPASLSQGDELWWRTKIWLDSAFQINNIMKFMRTHTSNPGTGTGPFNDIYIGSDFKPFYQTEVYPGIANEWFNVQDNVSLRNNYAVPKGQWINFEIYIKFNVRGSAEVRIWADEVWLYQNTKWETIDVGNVCEAIYLFTYFNDTLSSGTNIAYSNKHAGFIRAPSLSIDQTSYMKRDSNNFPIIGMNP